MSIFDIIDRQYRQSKPSAPSCCERCASNDNLTWYNIAPEGAEQRLLLCGPCVEFHVQATTPQWFWATGDDPELEEFSISPSREEAITAAIAEAESDGSDYITVCYSNPYRFDDNIFNDQAETIISEWWLDDMNEGVQCVLDLETSVEQDNDLAAMLNATFAAWRLKHRIGYVELPCLTKTDGGGKDFTSEVISVSSDDNC